MSLRRIQSEIHNIILNARRFERLINSPEFIRIFSNLQGKALKEAVSIADTYDFRKVYDWFITMLNKDIGELSIRELRERARKLYIARYSLMTKDELIRNITNEETRGNRVVSSNTESSGKNRNGISYDPQENGDTVIGIRVPGIVGLC